MIFDRCKEIATDGLLNVLEFDFMAYKKLLSKKKSHKTFLEMITGSHLANRKWSCYLYN